MSAYKKKRAEAALSPRDEATATLVARCPAAQEVLARAAKVLVALRSSPSTPHARWAQAKANGTRALQTLCNAWIEHNAPATPLAQSFQAEFAEAFGSAAVIDPEVLRAMQADAAEENVAKAEEQLRALRIALGKMRASYDDLKGHLTALQTCWADLFAVVHDLDEAGAVATSDAAKAPSGNSSADQTADESCAPAFDEMEAAVFPGTNLTLHSSVKALVPIVQLYERALFGKTLLVHALDALVHGHGSAEAASALTGSSAPAHSLLSPGADAALFAAVPLTTARALELYAASWALDADLSAEQIAAAQHMWDTQVPATMK